MVYMGSKNRIANELIPIVTRMLNGSNWYIEPFAGGMNLIDKVEYPLRLANDLNPYLIAMFQALLEGWEPEEYYERDFYERVRDNKHLFEPYLVGWVGFVCSYSGKFFNGFAGKVEKKSGKIENYQEGQRNSILKRNNNIKSQLERLKGVRFSNTEYYNLDIPPGSVVYCDPSYAGTTKYKTGSFDSDLFWKWAENVSEYAHVYVSEYKAPENWLCLWEKPLTVGLRSDQKVKSTEKLFYCFK